LLQVSLALTTKMITPANLSKGSKNGFWVAKADPVKKKKSVALARRGGVAQWRHPCVGTEGHRFESCPDV
jgi:hypothetical protein